MELFLAFGILGTFILTFGVSYLILSIYQKKKDNYLLCTILILLSFVIFAGDFKGMFTTSYGKITLKENGMKPQIIESIYNEDLEGKTLLTEKYEITFGGK